MKHLRIINIVLLTICTNLLYAQDIEWARSIGNELDNVVTNAIETPDGEFVVFSEGQSIIKIDQEGNYAAADFYLGFEFFDTDSSFYTSQKIGDQLIIDRINLNGDNLAHYEHTFQFSNYSGHYLFEEERFAILYEEELYCYDFNNNLLWSLDEINLKNNQNSDSIFFNKLIKNKNFLVHRNFSNDISTKIDPFGNKTTIIYTPLFEDPDPDTRLLYTYYFHNALIMQDGYVAVPWQELEVYINGTAFTEKLLIYDNQLNFEFEINWGGLTTNVLFSESNRILQFEESNNDASSYFNQYDNNGDHQIEFNSPDNYFSTKDFKDGNTNHNIIFGNDQDDLIIYNINFLDSTSSTRMKIGGSLKDEAFKIFHLSQDQYIIVGHSKSHDGDILNNNGDNDLFIAKINMTENYVSENIASINEIDTFCVDDIISVEVDACADCTHLWSTGDVTPTINIELNQDTLIYVTTTFVDGSSRLDSFNLFVDDKPELDFMFPDSINCTGDSFNAEVLVDENKFYSNWFEENGERIANGNFENFENETFIHELRSIQFNCTWKDTLPMAYRNGDKFSFALENENCFSTTLKLNGEIADSTTLNIGWSNGETDFEILANYGDNYAVEIRENQTNCIYRLDTTIMSSSFQGSITENSIDGGSHIINTTNDIISTFRTANDLIIKHFDSSLGLTFQDTVNNILAEPIKGMLNAPNRNIIIFSLRNRHVLLYNTTSRTLVELDMPFQPSAINISDREEIIIINNTNFARLDMNGDVIYQTEIPTGFLNNIQSVNHIGNKLYVESNGFNVDHKIHIWDFIENPYVFLELNSNQSSFLFYKINESQFLLAGEFIYQLQDGVFIEINQNNQLSNGIDLATQHNNFSLLLGDSKVFILNEKGYLLAEANHQENFNQDIAVIGDSIYLFSNRIIEKIKIPYESIYHQDDINTCDTIPLLNNNYTYQFSNGENDFDFVNQEAGKYWATITDEFGCMSIDTFIINDQLEISTSAINVPIGNRTDGFIQISVDNGVPPYTYTWSNGQNTARIENLTQGTYTVTVTDAAACETIKSIALNRIRIINDDVVDPGDIIIFPNPSPGPIIIFPLQQNVKQLVIMDIMGKIVMQFSNLQQEKLELDLSNLNKGIYFIKARKGNQDVVKKFILQ